MGKNTVRFEKKFMDRAIPLRFKINYWFLQKFGLFGFGFIAFFLGVLAFYLIDEYILDYFFED